MLRVEYNQLKAEIERVLLKFGVNEQKSNLLASIYSENSLVGVPSHGLNIFVNTASRIQGGEINPKVEPECLGAFGAYERWDGQLGLGPYNAYQCAIRAVALAKEHGIGCVSLRNTNHWGRAGKYSSVIADHGMIGVCATNGTSCMATWGGETPRIGNNPVSVAVPNEGGNIAVDMAFSQFSNGQLNNHRMAGKELPVVGGYDSNGELSKDPNEILATKRHIPVGFWKGAAFATLTDLVVSIAAQGVTTKKMDEIGFDMAQSQIFVAINFAALGGAEESKQICKDTIAYIKDTPVLEGFEDVRFPGQSLIDNRRYNLEHGVPVNEEMWQSLLAM